MPLSPTLLQRTLRKLMLESRPDGIRERPAETARVEDQPVSDALTPSPVRQGIDNWIRNSDHNHSVNTWWETAPSSTGKDFECANVYAYPPIAPVTILDASIIAATPDLYADANVFTADMVGRYVQIEGAGVGGSTLIAKIIAYIDAVTVTLDTTADESVGPAVARINLQRFGHTNKLNTPADNVSDSLKDEGHPEYLSNITDPDWTKARGEVRIGGANIAGYSLGRFNTDGTTYVALHQLMAGREPFARLNIVRANPYVKITGRLFLGIYNNHEEVLDFVKGSLFALSAALDPAVPSASDSTDYMVAIETDQGFTLVSEVLNVSAPTNAAIAQGARISLAWTRFAGALHTRVYRRRSAGNVFLMETFDTGANTWTDLNLSTAVDTGSTDFPVYANAADKIASYWASAEGEFDELPYDGEPGKYWKPVEVRLPLSPTVNMAKVFDPYLIVGLTEPLATELTDVVTNGGSNVTSAAGQFTLEMEGKAVTLIKGDGTETLETIVNAYVDANSIKLDTAPSWTSEANIMIIEDSQPRGLLYDCVGLSVNKGEWAQNPEDNSELRGQVVASNPNGSTQGGIGGQDPTGGGGTGGINCVWEAAMVSVLGRERSGFFYNAARRVLALAGIRYERFTVRKKVAVDVTLRDLVWDGHGYGRDNFNEIERINCSVVERIRWFTTIEGHELPCTEWHRVVSTPETFKAGTRVGDYTRGKYVLISDGKSPRLVAVSGLLPESGLFKVVSFRLKKTGRLRQHLIVINDIVSHNQKNVGIDQESGGGVF